MWLREVSLGPHRASAAEYECFVVVNMFSAAQRWKCHGDLVQAALVIPGQFTYSVKTPDVPRGRPSRRIDGSSLIP